MCRINPLHYVSVSPITAAPTPPCIYYHYSASHSGSHSIEMISACVHYTWFPGGRVYVTLSKLEADDWHRRFYRNILGNNNEALRFQFEQPLPRSPLRLSRDVIGHRGIK